MWTLVGKSDAMSWVRNGHVASKTKSPPPRPDLPLFASLTHSHSMHDLTRAQSVCMLFIHAGHTCIHIHTSPLRPILMPGQTMSKGCPQNLNGESVHADKWLVVCESVFFLGGRGVWWCRKDTLTNQSLDFSSRQAHGDLEFSRMTVWSQDPA